MSKAESLKLQITDRKVIRDIYDMPAHQSHNQLGTVIIKILF